MIIYMIIMGMMTSYWDDLIGMFFFLINGELSFDLKG